MLKKIKSFIHSFKKKKSIDNPGPKKEAESLEDEIINNKNLVVKLKKEYEHVFVLNIKGLEFIFRPLTKFEFFEYIINNPGIKDINLSEKICSLCVLYPKNYDFKNPDYAGIPDVLLEEIKEVSGFTNNNAIRAKAAEYRNINQNDFDHQMENIIMTAFPSITLEMMKDWNIYKLLDYFTRAEWVVNNMMPFHKLPYGGEEEEIPQVTNRGSSFFGTGRR